MKYKVVKREFIEEEWGSGYNITLRGFFVTPVRGVKDEYLIIFRSFEKGSKYTIGSEVELTLLEPK